MFQSRLCRANIKPTYAENTLRKVEKFQCKDEKL
jgi:hypothetical protein